MGVASDGGRRQSVARLCSAGTLGTDDVIVR